MKAWQPCGEVATRLPFFFVSGLHGGKKRPFYVGANGGWEVDFLRFSVDFFPFSGYFGSMRKRKKEDDAVASWLAAGVLIVLAMCALCWCTPKCDSPKEPERHFAKVGQKVFTNGPRWLFFDENDLDSAHSMALKNKKAALQFCQRTAGAGKAIFLEKGTPLTVEKVHIMNEAYYVFTDDGQRGWVQRWWVE